MKWEPIETAPKYHSFLVWLEAPTCGSHVQVCTKRMNITLIGQHFAFDMPKPLYWMPLPDPPAKAQGESTCKEKA